MEGNINHSMGRFLMSQKNHYGTEIKFIFRFNALINVNPVGGGGGGGSAGKGRGFDAWDYPRCRAFDRAKRPRGRDI